MKKSFFISTAIDYPSEKPHLGHCLEKIQADVLARYKRLQGFDVYFSIGTDEHGLKIQRYAQKANKKPQEFVDEISGYFKDLWKLLNISNNDFIRTTEKRHEKVVWEIIKKIHEKGDIYKGQYKGRYCVDCESYYLIKDLEEGNLCPVHHKPAEIIEEETYFFRMAKYQKQLLKHIKENKNFIIPESKRNEILNRLKEPLQDLSITRKEVKWGVPFPFGKNLTLFVWIDALINYLTTINYLDNKKFKKFWPADVHVIGKDIVWHHSVIWSSLLLSLGLPLPKTIFVHGFITLGGQKMSKSLRNTADPFEIIKEYGTDAVRYFLLAEFSAVEDGDFTWEKFKTRYNADLANGLGNFASRVSALRHQFSEAKLPKIDNDINKKIEETKKITARKLEAFKFNESLAAIWDLIAFGDKYINQTQVWKITGQKSKNQIISNLLAILNSVAVLLAPFLPATSAKISQLKKGEILFPRL